MLRVFLSLVALLAPVQGQELFRALPALPKQGQLLQLYSDATAQQVRFQGKTVAIYEGLALMPVPVHTPPGTYPLEWLDREGKVVRKKDIAIASGRFLVQNVQLPPAISELKSTSDERDEVSQFFSRSTPSRYWRLPIQAPLRSCLTSPFGVSRAINGKLTGDIHAGLDQRGATGTPIGAVTAGDVTLAGQFALHGGTVGIDHGQGLKSMYLHMSRIAVKPGDHVNAGDVIGFVGSTGRSTAAHLHWALYAQGEPVNPMQWLDLKPCPPKSRPAKVKQALR